MYEERQNYRIRGIARCMLANFNPLKPARWPMLASECMSVWSDLPCQNTQYGLTAPCDFSLPR